MQMTDRKQNTKSHFGDSNEVDPTPGWIPFVFVIAIAALFLIAFVFVAIFI